MFTCWMECPHAIKHIVVSNVSVSLALFSPISCELKIEISCIVNSELLEDEKGLTVKRNQSIALQFKTRPLTIWNFFGVSKGHSQGLRHLFPA